MTRKNRFLLLGGSIFLILVFLSQVHVMRQKDRSLKKTFSLLVHQNQSLNNHIQFLESREKKLLDRVRKAEESLHSFLKSE